MANAVVGKFGALEPVETATRTTRSSSPRKRTDEPQLTLSSVVESRKRILFVTPEISDFVKAGGLGEVSGALPRALAASHDVRVLIPGYRQVMAAIKDRVQMVGRISARAAMPACEIGRVNLEDGLVVYVLICPELYERPGNPYGDLNGADWADNHIRFGRLASAAADFALGDASIRWVPDLLHLNDWQTGLAAGYLRWKGASTPCLTTIHNLAYQGLFPASVMADLDIPAHAFQMEGLEFWGKVSFLKAGLVYADHITTVSHTYAQEITTAEFGCGLEGLLQVKARDGKLTGLLNGIDDGWSACSDPHLCQQFTESDWDGKAVNAARIREEFGLEPSNGPLFAVVSRLVQQKGIDLTIEAADHIVARGGQLMIIGCGEPHIERQVRALALRHPGRVSAHIGFCETEARRMYAGSDFLLMPSRFEPCGLSQMYAQRFASLPIATRTGGLADSIEDGTTGFLFAPLSLENYIGAIHRALGVFERQDLLLAMRHRAMQGPFFWSECAKPYASLYLDLLQTTAHQERQVGA